MNYIDLLVLGFAVLGLLFGLIGKAWKKIWGLVFDVIAIVIAVFLNRTLGNVVFNSLANMSGDLLGNADVTLVEALSEKIESVEIISKISAASPAFKSFISSCPKPVIQLVLFSFLSIILMILCNIIGKCIIRPTKKQKKQDHTLKKAIITFGLPGALRGLLVGLVLIFPIVVFSPVVKTYGETDLSALTGGSSEGEPTETAEGEGNDVLDLVIDTVSNSKFCGFGTKVLTKTNAPMLVYKEVLPADSTEKAKKYNFYHELGDVNKILESISDFSPLLDMVQGGFDISIQDDDGNLDPSGITSLIDKISVIGDALDTFDDLRYSFSEDGHFGSLLNEILIWALTDLPADNESLAMLAPADEADKQARIEAINTGSLKNDLLPGLLNSVIHSLAKDNPDLSFVSEVTFTDFDSITTELNTLAGMIEMFSTLLSDSPDFSELDVDDIKDIIASLGDSPAAGAIIEGFVESMDLGFEIDFGEVDWAEEAEAVGTLIELSQVENFEEVDFGEVIDTLAGSELALIAASNLGGEQLEVSEEQFGEIQEALAGNFPVDSEEYNTFISLFSFPGLE